MPPGRSLDPNAAPPTTAKRLMQAPTMRPINAYSMPAIFATERGPTRRTIMLVSLSVSLQCKPAGLGRPVRLDRVRIRSELCRPRYLGGARPAAAVGNGVAQELQQSAFFHGQAHTHHPVAFA